MLFAHIAHWTLPKTLPIGHCLNIAHWTLPITLSIGHCPNIAHWTFPKHWLPKKASRAGYCFRSYYGRVGGSGYGQQWDDGVIQKWSGGRFWGWGSTISAPPWQHSHHPFLSLIFFIFSSWLIWDDNGCRCRSIWTIFQTVGADIDINIEIDIANIGGLLVAG